MPRQAAPVPNPAPSLRVRRIGKTKFVVETDSETAAKVEAAIEGLLNDLGRKTDYELLFEISEQILEQSG